MQALEFDSKKKVLNITKKNIPEITDSHQVLVKVAYSGICGTDIHIIAGEFPCKDDSPVTMGHEFSGTVVKTGSDVTHVKVGDKVAVDPNNGCNVCYFCHSGSPHFCKIGGINNAVGIWRHGGWADYALVPDILVHLLPPTVSLKQGALSEPMSCVAHGWDRIAPVTVGQKILITGAGIIGNLWVIVLHLQGHRRVVVSEPNAQRRKIIEHLETGYECVAPEVLQERTKKDPNYLFDVIIDCSGSPAAIQSGFGLLNYGGKFCLFGVAPPHATVSISPFQLYAKEVTLYPVLVNPLTFPKSLGLLEALGDRYIDYEKLGIKTFKLSQYKEALDELAKGKIGKAVFEF
ncbi:D-arabinitol dehydrogenase 1-like [Agrilus planipennis]|uniref:D-arabinitol dehydrogenase 1-like n=1 Tax=Agrilus planipennis TaxID=224129 RepID=A0A7F5RI96_AGRPL|nr:D-arabinitol dehydrogenase 1-like [Agrilus planipennis]